MRAKQFGEIALLEGIRRRVGAPRGPDIRLGIGDDCALLRARQGEDIAVTTDLSIDGRHFRLDWHPPEAIGHRALARGLSDLAAMGARPVAAFLSLGLPPQLTRPGGRKAQHSWADRFFDGLLGLAKSHGVPLAGGDLAESPVAVADIVLIGAVPRNRALLRSTAKPGDLLYVTGRLGGAGAGLEALEARMASRKRQSRSIPPISHRLRESLAPHLYPQPRLAQGLFLQRRRLATGAIDLSDGLSTDLHHLCAESRVSAQVDAAALPIHPGATLDQALNGGEDYELLFTAAPAVRIPRTIAGVTVTRIGRIGAMSRRRPVVSLLTTRGQEPLAPRGWQHFSRQLS
jgi:thiamine-monophosphate kinase